jgi:hypothetical protein
MHYFTYGSNLHPVRLRERVSSATLLGMNKVGGHRLTFHKRGKDGSSKCNLLHTGVESDLVYGAIYKVHPEHKPVLDGFEGKGHGYTDEQIRLRHEGREYTCFTYVAQRSHIVDELRPYHWYKQLVVLGARYLQFPDSYVSSIESVESMQDRDEARRRLHDTLIERIHEFR